jgi:anhydro-N-acetylmuramic acid kinase
MNAYVKKLHSIAKKKKRLIIGLMSGTSLDGLDIVLCLISGSGTKTKIKTLKFETYPYGDEYKEEVRKIFSKQHIEFEQLCLLNEWIAVGHAGMVNDFLNNAGFDKKDVDIIASHGQTVYHAPKHLHQKAEFGNATLQIGDGDHLAVRTGIITISDFRQKHVACGGEGAPLAVYQDYLMFAENEKDVIALNIGGISNFTYIPARVSGRE